MYVNNHMNATNWKYNYLKTSIDYKLLYTINYNIYCNLITLQLKLAL